MGINTDYGTILNEFSLFLVTNASICPPYCVIFSS